MDNRATVDVDVAGEATRRDGLHLQPQMKTHYCIEACGPDGTLLWVEAFDNLVVDAGLNGLLDTYFKGASYTAAWYVGLAGGSPSPAAGDTLASHAGWTEVTAYSEGARQALTLGTVAGKSVDNSANKATFSINATTTVGGAFVCTAASGTSGTLYGVGAFTGGNKSLGSGDTLRVTVTLTAAAS